AERFKLDLNRRIRNLSSGNRRKVSVLSAFLTDADLLILDEPTGGLDPLMQHEFLRLVRERRAAGTTVFLSSHILSEVQSVADRMAVLRAGKIVAHGTVAEIRGLARQRVEVWFETDAPRHLATLPGIAETAIEGRRFNAVLIGSARPLIDALAGLPISSILINEPDLEEAFLGLYEDEPDDAAGADDGTGAGR
ncbi:MAG: AAA family ATPase, partial [Candidatus Limnocylindria bacterium]